MFYDKLTATAGESPDLRMIAHDMRAPLHALSLSVHAARRQNHNPEAVSTLLELAERNIQVLSSLVENMLDLGGGESRLTLRPCEPQNLVLCALDQVAALAAEKEQRIETADLLALPPIVADADRLVRVLVNLLANAIKFAPRGGHIQVKARLRINDGHRVLVFSVTDDGAGVPPDQTDRIFLKGVSAAGNGVPSTGLGLAVCRAIVEAHGGRIWVETGRCRGARFSYSIPADLPPGPIGHPPGRVETSLNSESAGG
jgi:Osmosensitive K+ channel histidine kinase